jgi:hypothetical protein
MVNWQSISIKQQKEKETDIGFSHEDFAALLDKYD